MLASKELLLKEMANLEDIKAMYKKANPDLPVWSEISKKKKKGGASKTVPSESAV